MNSDDISENGEKVTKEPDLASDHLGRIQNHGVDDGEMHTTAWEIFEMLYQRHEDPDDFDNPVNADTSTEIPDDPFIVAFALFCDLFGITRAAYSAFISICSLASPSSLSKLPKSYATLKKWTYSQLPLARIHSKSIVVNTAKLPAGPPRRWEPELQMYYFDKLEYVKRILANPVIRNRMYFGLQELVDTEQNLWQCRLWGESILSTSGQCIRPSQFADSEPLLPGDAIIYAQLDPRYRRNLFQCGKVRQVCMDHRIGSETHGQEVVVVQPIIANSSLPKELQQFPSTPSVQNRYSLVEDITHIVPIFLIDCRAKVFYADEGVVVPEEATCIQQHLILPAFFRVTQIVHLLPGSFRRRAISLRHELLGEAEIRAYGRARILDLLRKPEDRKRKVISIPTTTFIDGFTAFNKVQLSMLGVYTCPANIPMRDRLSYFNQFPLTLGPMGSNTAHAAEILAPRDYQLSSGHDILFDGEPVTIISFDLAKTGDMPQQNENCALNSHRASRSCRMCLVVDRQRSDTQYDIFQNGRYLDAQTALLDQAMKMSVQKKRQEFLRDWGIKPYRSIWLHNQPAFLPHRMTPQEPCHIFAQGLARIYQEILVESILTQSAGSTYSETIRATPTTPDWTRLQSPTTHHRSFSYNQYGQITQMNPYALRRCLLDVHITREATAGIKSEFAEEVQAGRSLSDIVAQIYTQLPQLMHVMFSRSIDIDTRASLSTRVAVFVNQYRRFIRACAKPADRKGYLQRSNIHAVLHLPETLQNFGIAANILCSPGEFKHKPFKQQAARGNHRNVDLKLLRRHMEWDAIRFTLDGAFMKTHPKVSEMLIRIREEAPLLFAPVSPISRWSTRSGIDDNAFITKLEPSGGPQIIRVGGRIKEDQLGPILQAKANPETFIRLSINKYYSQNDTTRLPETLAPFHVRYYQRVTFISPTSSTRTERLMSYHAGDMVSTATEFYLIDAIALPAVQGKSDVFLVTYELQEIPTLYDNVLDQPAYTSSKEPTLLHLSSILHEYPHFVKYEPAVRPPGWNKDAAPVWWRNIWYTAHY